MTPELYAWAARHHLTQEAVRDLQAVLGTFGQVGASVSDAPAHTEAGVQSRVRLAAANAGYLVWRNNVGAMEDAKGRIVRFGLANDSAAVNRTIKSSDLIGIKPGGQFWCREIKAPGWTYTGTDREQAQLRFIQLVLSQGGDAAFSVGGL